MDWHESRCMLIDLDVLGACQTRQMYESKPPQRESTEGTAGTLCGGLPKAAPLCGGSPWYIFDVLDKLKDTKIHQNASRFMPNKTHVLRGTLFGNHFRKLAPGQNDTTGWKHMTISS